MSKSQERLKSCTFKLIKDGGWFYWMGYRWMKCIPTGIVRFPDILCLPPLKNDISVQGVIKNDHQDPDG